TRSAFMRYRGQGHEIAVPLPTRLYREDDAGMLRNAFEREYRRLYSRIIPAIEVEVLSWVLLLSAPRPAPADTAAPPAQPYNPQPALSPRSFDPETGEFAEAAIPQRRDLRPGPMIAGPAIIVEDETSTVLPRLFDAGIDGYGYIELTRRES